MGDTEQIAQAQPRGRRVEVAGYRIARLDDGPYRWEVVARGIGVLGESLSRALMNHTKVAGLPLYRLPGYGVVYRAAQRWLHSHGCCVLRHKPLGDPDGNELWSCSWCGHRVTQGRPAASSRLLDGDRPT